MTNPDITPAGIANALEGVTDGPWAWNARGFVGPVSREDDQSYGMICDEVAECNHCDGAQDMNARFVAYARNALPLIAARLEALEAENAALMREKMGDL
jgi:hypothetical protein